MRLKVGDIVLDQFKDTIIAQNYEVNSFGDVTTKNGGYSNDFTLPLTPKNETALGFPSDLNISTREPYEKVDAQLVDSGAIVAIGYLRYKVIQDKTIKCSFFSTNTEWFNLIKDKKMTDLDLSAYDHVWDYTTIGSTIASQKTSGYTYPVIDYGFWGDETLITTQLIPSNQMFPAMFVSSLVSQVFTDIGWTLNGSLVEYNANNMYSRMIQPFSAKDFVRGAGDSFIDDNTLFLDQANTGFFVNTTQTVDWSGGSVTNFYISSNATYNIVLNLEFSFEDLGGSGVLSFIIRKNGTPFFTNTGTQPYGNGNSVSFSTSEFLTTGDVLSVTVGTGSADKVRVFDGNITFTPTGEYSYDDTITMSSTMPDMLQTDFIQYIFFIFGVVPQPDNYSKVLTCDMFRDIKDNIPSALDWSDKLDVSKKSKTDFTKLLNNYSKESILKYEEDDNDDELQAYAAETGQSFGQGQFDIDNDHLDPIKEIYTAPYTPMINIISFTGGGAGVGMYIPQIKYYDDPETPGTFTKEFEPNPKIGLLTDNITVPALTNGIMGIFRIHDPDDTGLYYDVLSVPFCWFAKSAHVLLVDAYTDSLAFDQIQLPTFTDETIIETYLEDQEEVLNNMKYLSAFFKLTEVDINQLNFMTPIYLDKYKSYFYINKVKNYQGSNKTTEVELVRISNG